VIAPADIVETDIQIENDSTAAVDDVSVEPGDTAEPISSVTITEWPECVVSNTPIIMVHGSFASGDTWGSFARRFMANGYCPKSLVAFDYNSILGPDNALDALDAAVDALLVTSGADQVDMMGHSLGGAVGYSYQSDPVRAAKVRKYVHVASGTSEGPADSDTPMLNLVSTNDLIVADNDGIPGADDVFLTEEDHYAVATSEAAFIEVYTFLNGIAPKVTKWSLGERTMLAGKALTFAENVPLSGGSVTLWEVDSDSAIRLRDTPEIEIVVREDGSFGPIEVDPNATYEWVVKGAASDDLPIHYFRERTSGSNPFFYLRTIPSANSLVGSLLAAVPFNDVSASLVLFMESRALVTGEDSLTINGVELATEALASPENCTIAMFIFDENENEESDNTTVELFASLPFFSGVDFFADANPPETIVYELNGRRLAVRALPGSQGAVLGVFD
jgi:pimeloyl-ACP methyl ester carboxylesterase